MTVRDCGSTSPSCSDISHHCQFSHFRVRGDIRHLLTWETLVEWQRIGIFMDKGSKYPSASVWRHRCWIRSLVASLIYDYVASCTHTRRHTALSRTADRKLRVYELYLKSCNTMYVLSKRPHLPPSFLTHPPIKTDHDFKINVALQWELQQCRTPAWKWLLMSNESHRLGMKIYLCLSSRPVAVTWKWWWYNIDKICMGIWRLTSPCCSDAPQNLWHRCWVWLQQITFAGFKIYLI